MYNYIGYYHHYYHLKTKQFSDGGHLYSRSFPLSPSRKEKDWFTLLNISVKTNTYMRVFGGGGNGENSPLNLSGGRTLS